MSDLKRKVTMRNTIVIGYDAKGAPVLQDHVATDYVPVEILDSYVADARTRWDFVAVADGMDAGPGGTTGATIVPDLIAAATPILGRTT